MAWNWNNRNICRWRLTYKPVRRKNFQKLIFQVYSSKSQKGVYSTNIPVYCMCTLCVSLNLIYNPPHNKSDPIAVAEVLGAHKAVVQLILLYNPVNSFHYSLPSSLYKRAPTTTRPIIIRRSRTLPIPFLPLLLIILLLTSLKLLFFLLPFPPGRS